MKKYLFSIAFVTGIALTSMAQRTPQLSPGASVMQTVGVTDFTVKYSRPSIKGRTVFADGSLLAPYGQLWRTGANMPTTFESGTEFSFGDRVVPAGKYALLSIPSGGAWTVILNKNYSQGTETYKQSDDVARISVAPASGEYNETFDIHFSNITDSTAIFTLSWSSVSVSVPLLVNTQDLTLTALNKAVAEKPEDVAVLQSTAGYLASKGKDLSQALALADKAIGLKESFSNLWLKAQILSKLGKNAEALPVAQKALALGATSGDASYGFFKGQIEKGITEIQSKITPAKQAVSAAKGKKKK